MSAADQKSVVLAHCLVLFSDVRRAVLLLSAPPGAAAAHADPAALLVLLEQGLPPEIHGRKGQRLWDTFCQLRAACAQLHLGSTLLDEHGAASAFDSRSATGVSDWYAVLADAALEACDDFDLALAADMRRGASLQ